MFFQVTLSAVQLNFYGDYGEYEATDDEEVAVNEGVYKEDNST
jgi:hypothetical protein